MALSGNTILVTGGGSGIGRGLAESLHRRGNTVIIAGRGELALVETAARNPQMQWVRLDVADPADIERVARGLIRRFPELNMLVNAAGVATRDDAAASIDDERLIATIGTNLLGPIRLSAALVEHFKTRSAAALVHVSSTLAYLPHAELPIYSASKAALHSYVLSQRCRLRGTSVAVIEIAPPMVATALDGNDANPRAMPLRDFIDETMRAWEAGDEEVLVAQSRQRRDRLLNDELGAMTEFNDMLSSSRTSANEE